MPKPVAAAAALAVAAAHAGAAVINVPADQPTIQAGINAAVSGADEVVVAPGVYAEHIDFAGKAITVRSTDPLDPAVVAATIIDGGGSGTVVTFSSGEGLSSVLDGFTVTNGNAVGGGGVRTINAGATIRHCVFHDNQATASGGAINVFGTVIVSLSDCAFYNNRAASGGAIASFIELLSMSIDDCTFVGNVATTQGGAVFNSGSGLATFDGCVITGNTAVCGAGGGLWNNSPSPMQVGNSSFCRNWPNDSGFISDQGGNVFDDDCPNTVFTVGVDVPTIAAAIAAAANGDEIVLPPGTYDEPIDFDGKVVTVRSSAGPAATIIDVQGAGRAVTLDNCEGGPWAVLQGLTITGGATDGDGAGLLLAGSSPTIIDCVITGNVAGGNGGGIRVTGGGSPAITGTVLSVNTAAAGGGLSAADGTGTVVTDGAFCANVPDPFVGLLTLNGLVYLSDEPGCAPLVALGGCCLDDSCVTTRQSDCAAAGGTYLGDDEPCGACPAPCPWDFNGDGAVDTADFLDLLGRWGACP